MPGVTSPPLRAGVSRLDRYVILEHDHPVRHWDLMLEEGGRLRTWRLACVPEAGLVMRAAPCFDHRRAYLDYEGPISGDRGQVVRWDWGVFTWLENQSGRVEVHLQGERCVGRAVLVRESDEAWSFTLRS